MVDLRQGIQEAATAMGMSPVDLATIISYETGGTFNPAQPGPTTQWGQHRGLIQFGEPQAAQYGVDWNNPAGSQLGADGAIVRYFQGNGWQPGMGLLDAYSIVNAGGPGRYNASDANNGGAPGTVADKVNEQMGGHRANAERMFGAAGMDVMTGSQGGDRMATQGLLSAPQEPARRPSIWDSLEGVPILGGLADPDRRARLAIGLGGMSLNPNQMLMAMNAQGIQQRADERDTAGRLNQTIAYLQSIGRDDLVALAQIDPGAALQTAMQPPETPDYMNVNGQIWDPTTQSVVADLRTPEAATPGFTTLTPEEATQRGLPTTSVWQIGPNNEIKEVSGSAAQQPEPGYTTLAPADATAMGLPAGRVWQVGPDGKLAQVDGSGNVVQYIVTGQAATDMGLDPAGSYNIEIGPNGPKATRIGGDGTTVNIEGDQTGPAIGTIPPGFAWVADPSIPAGGRLERIPGGPEDNAPQVAAAAARDTQQADVVLNTVKSIRETINGGGRFDIPEVGIVGARLAESGLNQEAVNVAEQLKTLQASVAFDSLAAMRAASPTGGALGAVSDGEMNLLRSNLGALSNQVDAATLNTTLDAIERTMAKFAAYPGGDGSDQISDADLLAMYGSD